MQSSFDCLHMLEHVILYDYQLTKGVQYENANKENIPHRRNIKDDLVAICDQEEKPNL